MRGIARIAVAVVLGAFAPAAAAQSTDRPEAQCLKDENATCKDALDTCVAQASGEAAFVACAAARKQCGEGAAGKCADEKKRRETARSRWIDWRNHDALRTGAGGALVSAGANEVIENAVTRELHYLSLSLHTLFFRNLPDIASGASVVLGVEVQGLLPNGRGIRTVLPPSKALGDEARITASNPFTISPIVYTGQNLTVTVKVQPIPAADVPSVAGRVDGAAALIRKVNPLADTALNVLQNIHASIFGAFRGDVIPWRYSFTLYPADSAYRDKPEMLLLAGRYVMILSPPASAPEELRKKVSLTKIIPKLQLRGDRLVWKESGDEFEDLPYLVWSFTRYARWPNPDTDLRKVLRQVDNLYDMGAYERALEQLKNVGAAIIEDRIITQNEKNLERALMDVRRAKIEAGMAKERNNTAEYVKCLQRQHKAIERVRQEFAPILEPFEIKSFDFDLAKLRRLISEAGGTP